jgi:hypothetical protein
MRASAGPFRRYGLTEDERYAVSDHVVEQLKDHGDPWRLNDEAKRAAPPTTSL